MPKWQGSTRRDRLPPDWDKIRRKAGNRDGWRCQVFKDGKRCFAPAVEIDHKEAGDNHELSNLQAICEDCHSSKSGKEGAAAMHKKRRQIDQKFRRTEEHPGLL